MDSLFSEDPDFRRVQYKKLSDNVREWQQEISAMVAEKLPKSLGVDVTVVFQKVDDEKGYAVGTAIARSTESGKAIGIPIIVKSWHLAPIDLFFSDSKIYPLTDDNLAKIFYQSSLGVGLASKDPPPAMVDDVYADSRNPPLGGKYSYSSPVSALSAITGTLGAEDLRLMKEAVAKQPSVLAGFHRNKTMSVLQKYAAETPKTDQQDDINKERASDTLTIKKEGPDSYRLFSSPDGVYDPVMISTNRQGIRNLLSMRQADLVDYEKDPMAVVDKYGHFTITAPESPYGKGVDGPTGPSQLGPRKNPWVFNPLQDDKTAVNVDEFGRYGVLDKSGILAKGWVIPNVVSFDGTKAPSKLFLSRVLSAYQSRIAGIPLVDDTSIELAAERPDTGKTGVFVYRDGKDIFATVPFQVTAVTIYKNLRSLCVVDVRGNQCNLILTPNIHGIVKIEDNGGKRSDLGPLLGKKTNYFVSAKMMFIRMPRLCAVTEAPEDFKRVAAVWLDHNPIKVAHANGRYVLRGGQVEKYAASSQFKPQGASHAAVVKSFAAKQNGSAGGLQAPATPSIQKVSFDFNSLARHEAEFLLGYWGLGSEKVAEVLDQAKNHIRLEVHHLRFPEITGSVKTASAVRTELATAIKAPIAQLLKIAANINDAQAVDSVLSLGFVNPENIARFASIKPMLWEVSHMLAKLLLASRLGMEDLPEEAIRSALDHLQRVIDGLSRLSMLEQHAAKTASVRAQPIRHVGGRLMRGVDPVGITR